MNYLLEIKAFYDKLEVKPLSPSAIALWHALMHIGNKTGWVEEFSVAVSVLSLKSGLSERSVSNARNELKTKGYIHFRSRSGNRSALYQMISLPAYFASNHSNTRSNTFSGSTSAIKSNNDSTLFKQKHFKQNKKEDPRSEHDMNYVDMLFESRY